MANNNEYTIIIKRDSVRSNESPIAGGSGEEGQSKGFLSKEGAKSFMKGVMAYKKVKGFAVQVANHEVSLVQLRTGSNELQQRADFINDVVQKGVGALESVAIGAAVGGLPGAIVGLVSSGVSYAIQVQQRKERLNLESDIEKESIQRNLIRAGASNSRANQL